jgi:hypothetical protein
MVNILFFALQQNIGLLNVKCSVAIQVLSFILIHAIKLLLLGFNT